MSDQLDPVHRELLFAFLRDRDAHCPLCQYNLRNSTGTSCPECGKPIALQVSALDIPVQAWAVTVVTWSLAAGLGIPLFIMLFNEGRPRGPQLEIFTYYCFVAAMPVPLMVLMLRRRFLRLQASIQFYIAVGSACIVAGLFFMFFRYVMG
jgi:hypothetical protein